LSVGCGGKDQGKGYLLRHAGVTLIQAAQLAEQQVPGRAVRVELLYNGRHVIYHVEVVDAVNQSHQVAIDAETGKVVP
jgi:uncharacterized membrane protein YkoI